MQIPEMFTTAGFYYFGIADRVKCFFCDRGLRNWEPNGDAWRENDRWFQTCGYFWFCEEDGKIKGTQHRFSPPDTLGTSTPNVAKPKMEYCNWLLGGAGKQVEGKLSNIVPEVDFNHWNENNTVQSFKKWCSNVAVRQQLLAELEYYYTGTGDRVQCAPQVLAELGFYYTCSDDQVKCAPQVLANLGIYYNGSDDRVQCAPQLLAELGFYYTGTDDRFQCAPQVLAKLGFYYTCSDDRVQCAPQVLAELGFYFTGRDDRVQFAFYRVIVRNWEAGDKRDAAPESHVIQCPFTLVNIPMGNDNETPSGLTVFSTITRHTLEMFTTGFSDTVRDLEEEIQKSKEEITCKVCLDEEVNIMFLPCGHFVYDKCDPAMRCCPICR